MMSCVVEDSAWKILEMLIPSEKNCLKKNPN